MVQILRPTGDIKLNSQGPLEQNSSEFLKSTSNHSLIYSPIWNRTLRTIRESNRVHPTLRSTFRMEEQWSRIKRSFHNYGYSITELEAKLRVMFHIPHHHTNPSASSEEAQAWFQRSGLWVVTIAINWCEYSPSGHVNPLYTCRPLFYSHALKARQGEDFRSDLT